ncbi:MAG: MotA/TolQ/ExbB proton channel family protein [Paludibacteraceae bacterium]|nr:MotA/TolQ/ExbB proton channel family protein [Paludibacteraceae bacterium]
MKKFFAMMTVVAFLAFGAANVMAQDAAPVVAEETTTEAVVEEAAPAVEEAAVVEEEVAPAATEEQSMYQVLKIKFIEGGAGFMSLVVFCLIFGLALSIERIIYLNLANVNTNKLLRRIDEAWAKGGVEAALEVCRNTRGPIASIFYQGLSRYDEGVEVVEKSVASYGSVQLGLLERNLSWISLFIGLSSMLGFLGTIVGMIQAFDKIQQVGDMSASVVAGGIKVALLTTLLGLVVAMILQVFYNYLLARIDSIVTDMEDSSISLLDIVVKYSKK